MAEAFRAARCRMRARSVCLECGSGRPFWAVNLKLAAFRAARERSLRLLFRWKGRPEGKRTMKILLADDHAVVRHGLKQILADEFRKAAFGEARNATEALELVWKENWDVVVL